MSQYETTICLPEQPAPAGNASLVRLAQGIRKLAPAIALSAVLLVPCFWQSRIQAGDLSSHVYNAWLATLTDQGKVEGLVIVHQWTNVVFDLLLKWLLQTVGAEAAQRIAVPAAVLVFFWGAFSLVSAFSPRPWLMAPCLAILAYGWVFHMGLFNFYLSLGLCFFALAIFWRAGARLRLAVVPILLLACLAHVLPVAWAIGVGGYAWAANRVAPRRRIVLFVAALSVLAASVPILRAVGEPHWSAGQVLFVTGADQTRVYGPDYSFATLGVLLFWFCLFVGLASSKGPNRFRPISFQIIALNAAAILILPVAVDTPIYHAAPNFLSLRLSLAAGVWTCAVLAPAGVKRWEFALISLVAVFYFSRLYIDTEALNRIEDRMEAAVGRLHGGQRVVGSLYDKGGLGNHLLHMLDRVCIGRCFSYANYEPSTGQFRIRALPGNPVVMAERRQVEAIELGHYVVGERDLPLYQLTTAGPGNQRFVVRPVEAGEVIRQTSVDLATFSGAAPGRD